ncbi:hypothetical protein L1D13_12960 [Vibrio tubiashii]|uniref:protein kinase domain-containing protein n=1 Tax=Vibrio tubiashii TaxID=29498 RepID=UPI001EFD0349|nr:hypothetical protein [Vibrio tubiashii]MCG9582669.1 hypothetical protein [Vibrio tubiashii]MCG9616262.1 hypothetical protein [Vibrio tubiashii]MCG9687835.1 hypothetical protein [Vibrio tubiashii]
MKDASFELNPSILNSMRALGVSYCSHIGHQVYLVDSASHGKVALKFALSTLAKSQLHNEASFLANYASDYWPSFIDADSHHQASWLMYAFVEGQSLADCTAQPNTTLISKLETGLKTIHETGFIHGDIKPANIVTSTNGDPVFVDLGSVLSIGRPYAEQPHSSVTPSFASVNALKRHGLIGIQDDYVSLAVTLQTITDKHPYQGQSITEYVATKKLPKLGALPAKYQILFTQQLRMAKRLAASKNTG